MRNLVPDILPLLEAHSLKDLDAGSQAIYPYYDGYNLVNLPASICRWLGIEGFGARPLAREIVDLWQDRFANVILLVVDGMGLDTLESARSQAQANPGLAVWNAMDLAPLTSLVPSTTAAALTTFWTGRHPGEHGVVGYEVWLKEYNLIANMIYQNPASFSGDIGSLRRTGFLPETFLPVATFGSHLRQQGIHPYAFQHQTIARSGLSTMLMQDVDVIAFRSLSDLFVSLDGVLEQAGGQKYIYVYWGDLDEHSHHFGPQDERVALELNVLSRQLQRFLEKRSRRSRGDTLVLVTADHGHLSTPRRPEFELRRHPDLMDCLVMSPSGEARLPYVYLRPGCEARFLDYLAMTWPGQFLAVPSSQAISSGLFGSGRMYERLPERVGDYIVIPQDSAYWWFATRDNPLLGRHGGLSRTEMLVPLLGLIL